MRVIKDALSWASVVRKDQRLVIRVAAVEMKFLTIVARIVVNRLNHRSIAAHQPISRTQSMLQRGLPIFAVACVAARPPQQLEIHHRVYDGVVSILTPCRNQLRDWVVHAE